MRDPTTQPSDKRNVRLGQVRHSFMLGGLNDTSRVTTDMTIDDLEIWYGTRDYLQSLCVLEPCQGEHYIIGECAKILVKTCFILCCLDSGQGKNTRYICCVEK